MPGGFEVRKVIYRCFTCKKETTFERDLCRGFGVAALVDLCARMTQLFGLHSGHDVEVETDEPISDLWDVSTEDIEGALDG